MDIGLILDSPADILAGRRKGSHIALLARKHPLA
jgi:hypothetical protein